jgi:hypothetical protein
MSSAAAPPRAEATYKIIEALVRGNPVLIKILAANFTESSPVRRHELTTKVNRLLPVYRRPPLADQDPVNLSAYNVSAIDLQLAAHREAMELASNLRAIDRMEEGERTEAARRRQASLEEIARWNRGQPQNNPQAPHTQAYIETVANGTAHANHTEEQFETAIGGGVTRQPLDAGACCPICLDDSDLNDRRRYTWCRNSCGANIHIDCIMAYLQHDSRRSTSCPCCRAPWHTETAIETSALTDNFSLHYERMRNT